MLGQNVCGLCQGTQNLVCVQFNKREWHTCIACNGWGMRLKNIQMEEYKEREKQ